ncbi:myosin heavy chain kinase D-like [Patiria miniata]|uniref:Alpha-type protein kinase domain-containing protein n=1 Tax=Patiria miniata TaxID=46514 RepID=A0A914AFR7_PATMI|nr:myosin heavy chain kinase D-like [Patiria miniata]
MPVDQERMREKCVVKHFKEDYCARLQEDTWYAHKRTSMKAHEMAERFNVKHSDKGIPTIEVLIPIISKVKRIATHSTLRKKMSDRLSETGFGAKGEDAQTADAMVPEGTSVAIEHFIRGRFVQFSNNFGNVNPNENTLVPVAFSHFTYHESNGQILVTDLQGVYNQINNQNSYIFTDPAIHSIDNFRYLLDYYGSTDLGANGVLKFFQNHKCNHLCDGLIKPVLVKRSGYRQKDQVNDTVKLRGYSTNTCELPNVGLQAQPIQELHNNVAKTLALSGRHGELLHRSR